MSSDLEVQPSLSHAWRLNLPLETFTPPPQPPARLAD